MTRRSELIVVALVLTAADFAQKARSTVYEHDRSLAYAVLACALALSVAALVPRIPSRGLAIGGGVACGGALGNAVAALVWGGVPNPILAGGVAFNIADLCVVVGALWLVVGAAVFGLRHPQLLREPL